VPEFDLEQFYMTDAPARVRAFLSEADLPHIDTADSLPDAMNSSAIILPGLFGIVGGMPNMLVNGKRRLVVGARKKLYRFQPVFAVVTEDFGPKADGRLSGMRLCQLLANIFDGWRAPGMISTFDVINVAAFVARGFDVARVQHQFVLEGKVELFTTPVL
jgi:hypothetical protein